MREKNGKKSCKSCRKRDVVQSDSGDSCFRVGRINWNRDQFFGTLIDGKFQGKGEYRFKNGDRFTGNFKDGKSQGLGQIIYENGNTYEGEIDSRMRVVG